MFTVFEMALIARFMGPIWGWQDPGGPRVGPMNFAMGGLWCNGWLPSLGEPQQWWQMEIHSEALISRADSNGLSHWLGAYLESSLISIVTWTNIIPSLGPTNVWHRGLRCYTEFSEITFHFNCDSVKTLNNLKHRKIFGVLAYKVKMAYRAGFIRRINLQL